MTEVCGIGWPNTDLPDLPHSCVIRVGWHVNHACHCGAILRVTDADQVENARRHGRAVHAAPPAAPD